MGVLVKPADGRAVELGGVGNPGGGRTPEGAKGRARGLSGRMDEELGPGASLLWIPFLVRFDGLLGG